MKREARELLQSLRAAHSSIRHATGPVSPDHAAGRAAFDFTELGAFEQVRIAKSASAAFGVPSPFFRVADAVEGTRLRVGDRWVENFASYDYLGLNAQPELRTGAAQGVDEWGVSATASRLVGGERAYHGRLERELAEFVGTEAALTLVSGHATNVGLLRTLMGPGDLVAVDALAHNSIYEGIRASGASHVSFPHGDADWLDRHLTEVRGQYRHCLIAIEGLYSMDGDAPDLARFIAVKAAHDAWVMVDEAHSLGVLGGTGRGLCEAQGIDPAQVEIIMGTLSKSLCACGGFVAGSAGLVDLLRYTAPGFVYSVGLSAPDAYAALSALDLLRRDPGRVARLAANAARFFNRAHRAGLDCGRAQGHAVLPVMIGDSLKATWVSNKLFEAGINALPIIAPAVPDREARIRFFVSAGHSDDAIDAAVDASAELVRRVQAMGFDDIVQGGG